VQAVTGTSIEPGIQVMLIDAPPIETQQETLAAVLAWIEGGGTGVFLSPRAFGLTEEGRTTDFWRGTLASCPFGQDVRLKQARGLWWAVDHVVKTRPITAGMPSAMLMDLHYCRRIHPIWSYVGLPRGDVVCAGLGIGTCGEQDNCWAGADLTVLPWGRGRAILSTLLVAEHLGSDPAADRLALNLAMHWAGN